MKLLETKEGNRESFKYLIEGKEGSSVPVPHVVLLSLERAGEQGEGRNDCSRIWILSPPFCSLFNSPRTTLLSVFPIRAR